VATQSTAGFGERIPFNGRLLIADRGNNRLLLVDARRHVLWTYLSPHVKAPAGGFYYPDDAFFADRGRSVIVNEEGNQVVVRLPFRLAGCNGCTAIRACSAAPWLPPRTG
jgi:hypothetical protein